MVNIDRYVDTNKLNFVGALCSDIIKEMLAHDHVHLYTKESFSFKHNGLYDLLDQLCEYWGWRNDQFTLSSPNLGEQHSRYNIKYIEYFYDGLTQGHFPKPHSRMIDQLRLIKDTPWDGSYDYGLFVGRANATRLRAIELHHKWQYRNRGLTSFLTDLDQYVDPQSLLTYLCESNARWSEIRSIRPYSDVGDLLPVPVQPPYHILGWESIYQKIPIEIVCETSEVEESRLLSEKISRPMLYRRPFLLISGRNSLRNFREHVAARIHTQVKTFDHVIPTDYDQDEGIARVDHVFDILHELIRTKKINKILEQCRDDIEHNYNCAMAQLNDWAEPIEYNRGPIGTEIDMQRIKNEQR